MIFYQRRTIDSMKQRLFIVIDKMLSNCGITLMHELPSSSAIFLRPVPVGEFVVGATSATPDADTTFSSSCEQ